MRNGSILIFGWLLNGIYLALLVVVSPILIYRRVVTGKYRHGWKEKLTGRLSRQFPERPCIWFHAVSVGEVLQLQKILEETESRFPEAELLVSVTTDTGYEVAKQKYPQYSITYFPLDFTWSVARAFRSIRPSMVVLVELELWPNFIFGAHARSIPLALINGRMGAKSFRGYSRIKALVGKILSCFDILAVQNETYFDRLRTLGASPERVVVTGNIKFDRVESNRENARTIELRSFFGLTPDDKVFIAGSTQDPEESYAIQAWLALQPEFPNLKLILVPRHKERFEEVAALIRHHHCRAIRRSEAGSSRQITNDGPSIGLLDTLGELAACWGLADIAFVGGSLTNRGGQNMIEPAAYGAVVLFGPNTWNFKDITEALLFHRAARVIRGSDELRETVRELLRNREESLRMGEAARAFVSAQQGATARTVNLLERILRRAPDRLTTIGS